MPRIITTVRNAADAIETAAAGLPETLSLDDLAALRQELDRLQLAERALSNTLTIAAENAG